MLEMSIESVRVSLMNYQRVVILKEKNADRYLPIWIGPAEADAIAERLQSRGYKAYVVAPAAGGQVIYKVRVGVNMQRQEADEVMRRLQSEEKFKPWITR